MRVNVHVSESRLDVPAGRQRLTASIDGKKYKLKSEVYRGAVLALGDYKAKLVKDEPKVPYELNQWYELLFPVRPKDSRWSVLSNNLYRK